MGNTKFSKESHFSTKELIPLRIQFWHYEYLKRHLLIHEKNLCLNILRESEIVFERLAGKVRGLDESKLLYAAIYEYFWMQNFPNSRNVNNKIQFDILANIGSAIDSLHNLYTISMEYGFYAHKLIFPSRMDDIIEYLKNNGDLADKDTDVLFANTSDCQFGVCISPKEQDITVDDSWLHLELDVTGSNFNFKTAVHEIAYHIAARRHFLRIIGAEIQQSNEEKAYIAQYNIKDSQYIKKTADESRAIGLWCWDAMASQDVTYKRYINYTNNEDLPFPYPCNADLSKLEPLSTKNLLFNLLENGLLKNFYKDEKDTPCDVKEKNCLYTQSGKNTLAGPKERFCPHFDSCMRKLRGICENAKKSIELGSVIKIS